MDIIRNFKEVAPMQSFTFHSSLKKAILAMCLVAITSYTFMPAHVFAATTALTPTPKVTFTFDDGLSSALLAAKTLQASGFTGTDYIITQCVGFTTTQTCANEKGKSYMSWDDIAELQNTYHWNIGSHTQTHPYLASTGDGEQVMLTTEQIHAELANSKADLLVHGYDAIDFAAPYGDYNNIVLAEAAKIYTTFRGFADINPNLWPYNERLVQNYQVQDTDGETSAETVARVKTYIDTAIAQNQWVTLTFHEITAGVSSGDPDNYQFPASGLAEIAEYVKSKGVAVVTPHDAIVNNNTNMLSNGTFDTPISTDYANKETNGLWTTDETTGTLVHSNSAGNGSLVVGNATSPTNSIRIAANGGDAHIWAPKVAVDPNTTYVIKGYFNIETITGGEVAYYIDEYDASGKIIDSTTTPGYVTPYSSAVRYDANVNAIRVKNANFAYKPTAGAVAARLYINVQANSGITGYMDNIEMFSPVAAPTDPQPTIAGDINTDGKVDALDASILFGNWQLSTDGTSTLSGDINKDNKVDALDASILFGNWS